MIVKQYTVALPADYDMQIIRERVASKAPVFDDFPGLGVIVFMIRQKDRFGAESNDMHRSISGHRSNRCGNSFAGHGFRGIVDSFGWTPIHYWLGFAYAWAGTSIRELCEVSRVNRA
jgi:hypothetical protein